MHSNGGSSTGMTLPHLHHPLTLPGTSNPFASLIDQNIATLPQFTFESGVTLKDVPVAYKTWGRLNERADNCLVICHALTGSADVEDW